MARYDVFDDPDGGYLVDVRADELESFGNRILVPLLPRSMAPRPMAQLNPVFAIDGLDHVFMTQLLASVPRRALRAPIGQLAVHRMTSCAPSMSC